jgi:hypothetical protein
MNKLLMEENDRLQKQVSHLVYENGYFRQHTQNVCFFAYCLFTKFQDQLFISLFSLYSFPNFSMMMITSLELFMKKVLEHVVWSVIYWNCCKFLMVALVWQLEHVT